MGERSWGMVVDVDRCTGCQACVVACQSENNIPINEEEHFNQRRAIEWIRIERYWEGCVSIATTRPVSRFVPYSRPITTKRA